MSLTHYQYVLGKQLNIWWRETFEQGNDTLTRVLKGDEKADQTTPLKLFIILIFIIFSLVLSNKYS